MAVFVKEDVARLAKVAWLAADGRESERLCEGLNEAASVCSALFDIDLSDGGGSDPKVSKRRCVKPPQLREDVPTKDVSPEVLIEMSPSAGGYGFTIPRMME